MSIIVVLTDAKKNQALIRWGLHFAYARQQNVLVLNLLGAEITEESTIAGLEECREGLQTHLKNIQSDTSEFSHQPIVSFRSLSEKSSAQVLEEAKKEKGSLLVLDKGSESKSDPSFVLVQQIAKESPIETVLFRLGESTGLTAERILVPAAGGPHADIALRLASKVSEVNEGETTALYVEPGFGEDAKAVGESILDDILLKARVNKSNRVKPKVVLSDQVGSAIAEEAHSDYDLLLLGASNVGRFRHLLFGTIPSKLLSGDEAMAIGIIRGERPLSQRIRETVGDWVGLKVPQLEREARIALFKNLQANSDWNFDFIALILLSTSIAALGLLADSTAVVIGAMLVAPLMTPLLGAGLSVVQGNAVLLRASLRAICLGFVSAMAAAFVITALIPTAAITREITLRGSPSVLDLAIAFLSGIAAAHCTARPNLSAALPGVAIAAALVPPIASSGIALQLGEFQIAKGAAVLFGVNVIMIILSAAFTFSLAGAHSSKGEEKTAPAWKLFFILLLLTAVLLLAVPLFQKF